MTLYHVEFRTNVEAAGPTDAAAAAIRKLFEVGSEGGAIEVSWIDKSAAWPYPHRITVEVEVKGLADDDKADGAPVSGD